jgi:hypothetical protein
MVAMRQGSIARLEELTRIPADVQDALITVLSEKTLPVPELGHEVQAPRVQRDRDRQRPGPRVNELSSALADASTPSYCRCRDNEEDEVSIVASPGRRYGAARCELP